MRGARRAAGVMALLAVLALLSGSGSAVAGGTRASLAVGRDFRISGLTATGRESSAAVAWNGTAQEFLVVWMDDRDAATRGWEVFGRRVGTDGTPSGGEFRISGPVAAGDEVYPSLAWSETSNQYLVVWQDQADDHAWDILGRRVDGDGTPLGSEFLIGAGGGDCMEYDPAVAWGGAADEYLVVWRSSPALSTRGDDIRGQRVAADGSKVGHDFRVSGLNATSGEWSPALVWNETAGEYLVVWADGRSGATREADIYGRRVGADGSTPAGDFRISGRWATSDESVPKVEWNPTAGEYLVVWTDGRGGAARGADIYGRRLAADGARLGSDFRISGRRAVAGEVGPEVTWSVPANRYLVIWQDGRYQATRGLDIFGRRLAADGTGVGGAFRVSGRNATSDESRPTMARSSRTGDSLVVWEDARDEAARGWDIYGRRVDEADAPGFAWARIPYDEAVFGSQTPGLGTGLTSVAAGGPGFVAVGTDGAAAAVWVSADGYVWARIPHDAAVFGGAQDQVMSDVLAGGPGLVAVGYQELMVGSGGSHDAVVWVSADGHSWDRIPAAAATFGDALMFSAAAGGPGLVAVGHSLRDDGVAAVWVSVDGYVWTRIPYDAAAFGGEGDLFMASVVAGGPGLVAVGSHLSIGGWDAAVWVSVDGYTWARIPDDGEVFGGNGDQRMTSVAAGGPGVVAVGYDGGSAAVWVSADGYVWTQVSDIPGASGAGGSQFMASVVAGGPGLIGGGFNGSPPEEDAAVWVSTDGWSWDRIPSDEAAFGTASRHVVSSVAAGASSLVAVGWEETAGHAPRRAVVWVSPPSGGPISALFR